MRSDCTKQLMLQLMMIVFAADGLIASAAPYQASASSYQGSDVADSDKNGFRDI